MKPQTDPAREINDRITRSKERIARWDKEADGVEPSWIGAPAYRTFCQGMAGSARDKKAELEAELQHLQE